MLDYNLFIICIIALFILDHIYDNKKCGPFSIIAIIVIISFDIFRDHTGYDYAMYVNYFSLSKAQILDKNLEPGFIGVVILLKTFTKEYFWLFAVFGISTILLVCRGIKLYTRYFRVALLLYILTPGLFLNSFSIIRQGLAIAIVFNSFYYFYKCKYNTFSLLILLASLFHYTALLTLPCLLVSKVIAKHVRSFVLVGIPISLALSKIGFITYIINLLFGNTKFIAYATYIDQGTSFIKLLLLNSMVLIYLWFYKNMNTLNRTLLSLIAIGLILTNICSDVAAITRIGYYFKIFDCILLANILSMIQKPHTRAIFIAFVVMYYYALFYNALNVDLQLNLFPKLTPYKTIFNL